MSQQQPDAQRDRHQEFMSAMVDDHEDAVRDLRSRVDEDRSLKKTSVNQWAADTLPMVESHLDRAKQIRETLEHNNRTR